MHAPAWDRAGRGSSDSADDDAHSLTFETAPLEEQLEILGTPEIEVTVSSDKTVGLVAARLLAISPTGDGHLITRGSRNLAFPDELSTPLPIEPGTPISVRFPLMTSVVLPAGWRLRLALSGADFPVVWPPGEAFTLSLDPSASRLRLPTVPVRGDESRVSIPVPEPLPQPPGLEDEDRGKRRSSGTARPPPTCATVTPKRSTATCAPDLRVGRALGGERGGCRSGLHAGQSRGGVDHGTT